MKILLLCAQKTLPVPDFIHIRLLDVVDIVMVAILLYQLYRMVKGTAAIRIFAGIFAIYLLWKITQALQLKLLSEILGQFIGVGVIALIIVFQQEIRRFLLYLGSNRILNKTVGGRWLIKWSEKNKNKLEVEPIIKAVENLSLTKTGALLVISHQSELKFYTATGVEIDALIHEELIESIFFKNNPLHDGAAIIYNNRIKAVKCVLPISDSELPPHFGLRHRAAMGITETSSAAAIVVSEETGEITYFENAEFITKITPIELKQRLMNL